MPAHPLIQALKLLVPVGLLRAFPGFGIGLQAVLQGRDEKNEWGDDRVGGWMSSWQQDGRREASGKGARSSSF